MIKAFLFDVFGTVVDWREGVAKVSGEFFTSKGIGLDPHLFADAWRGEYQPSMEKIRSGNRGYVPLDQLHLENLETILEREGLTDKFSVSEKKELNKAWEQLPAWSDSAEGIKTLREKALVAPCSNGSIALMTRLSRFTGLQWDCILGAEIAGNYKPHPDAYLTSVSALGLQPQEVTMVAAHNDDLVAARRCGLKTAFIPRKTEHGRHQTTDLSPVEDWDYCAESIELLAETLK